MSEKNISFSHNPDRRSYVIEVEGTIAGHADYSVEREGVRNFHHTVIDPAFRGQGLSSPLIKYALDDTAETGEKIVPSCSAVAHFISKNPEYRGMVS